MKTFYFLFFVPLLLAGTCCEDEAMWNYDGTGGISCEVDGELMVICDGGLAGDRNYSRIDMRSTDTMTTMFLQLSYQSSQEEFDNSATLKIIIEDICLDSLNRVGFDLLAFDENSNTSYGELSIGNLPDRRVFRTDSLRQGHVSVRYFDEQEMVITGNFQFDAANEDGEVVEIRNGIFDLKL